MSERITRRSFLSHLGVVAAGSALTGCNISRFGSLARDRAGKPNFIVIFIDDMGYGDLGCFGSKKHRTPNIDRMAAEGMRFTDFYVSSGVCSPSRASLMSGCYPSRVNMHENGDGLCVLLPADKKGLHPDEITIADLLKPGGYATCCIGKWHLGDQPQFLPTRQGFDYYFGIPYSNDMGPRKGRDWPDLPLLRNEKVVEAPVDQNTITERYTNEVIKFITANKDRPFFIYLPHTMVHDPLHAGDQFRGKSGNGIYGDAVEEVDFSTGQILKALKDLDIDERTLVLFTSDNGAAPNYGGTNQPLRGHKGTTWEGGMRVPCIVRYPGKIPAGSTCQEMTCTMDLLPTFAALALVRPPKDRIIDGKNIWPLLAGQKDAKSPHQAFYYYQIDQLQAVRSGKWKLHLPLKEKRRNWGKAIPDCPLQLYDLRSDIAEQNNIADRHPDVVKRLLALTEKARYDLGDVRQPGKNQRPAGWEDSPKPLLLNKNQ